jgi:hypothetical protein
MASSEKRIDRLIEDLKQARDELGLKMHLAAADARDEWEQLEKKWEHLNARAKRVGEVAGDAAEDVGEALEIVAGELKKGYERIREML